jgi:hypothetical protein
MPLMRLVEPDSVAPVAGAAMEVATHTGGAEVVKTAVAEPAVRADFGALPIGYLLVAAGAAAGIILWDVRDPAGFTPGEGISIFAPLYILAQGIERFIEPFTSFFGSAAPDDQATEKKKKSEAQHAVSLAIAKGDTMNAAKWQESSTGSAAIPP